MVKVLVDTDIGSDINDALCLAYLLRQPNCELVGITTVTGGAVERARLAEMVCRSVGRDVPVHPGAERPLLGEQLQREVPQAEVLDRWPHLRDFSPNSAVDFLRRSIRAHPGGITLLTIGPLTNIAILFALDPEIPRMLKGMISMCGYFGVGGGVQDRSGTPASIRWQRRWSTQPDHQGISRWGWM